MGLSSSQARLLNLTSRMHQIEYKAAKLEAQKLQMANESRQVHQEYLDAMEKTKIQIKTLGIDGSINYIDANYNNMIESGYKLEFQEKVKVTQRTADNFETAKGNKDYFVYLQTGVSGAPDDYTPIYTAEQLKNIGLNGKYMLMTNIDLGGADWAPIGDAANPFTGTFDGNGHSISNFKIESSSDRVGFFGRADNATITNVVINNANITTTGFGAGVLVGYAKGSTITNCAVTNCAVKGNMYVGGLAGYLNASTVDNCSSSVSVVSETSNSGGFAGQVWNSTITNSSSAGSITALSTRAITSGSDQNTGKNIGGFAGSVGSNSIIDNCSSSCNVSGCREVGGFAGISDSSTITNSIATGNVTGKNSEGMTVSNPSSYNYGGFIGVNNKNSTITNCAATGDVSGFANVGGFVGQQNGNTISNSYATGKATHIDGRDSVTNIPITGGGNGGFAGISKSETTNCYYNATANNKAVADNSATADINPAPSNVKNIAGPTTTTKVSTPPVIYKNRSDEAKENEDLFDRMNLFGYEIDDGTVKNPAEGHETDNEWFTNMVNNCYISIYKQDSKGDYYQTSVATDTNLQEVSNERELRRVEAKYEADMLKIDKKDRKYDYDLAALDAERNAIKQEMETLKTVARENVDRTFKLFS